MYSLVTKIVRGAENNAGPIQTWPDYFVRDEEFFKEYIEPQIKFITKVSNIEGGETNNCPDELLHMCVSSSNSLIYYYGGIYSQVYLLANGAALGFYVMSSKPEATFIVFDVNGEKDPNMTGVDIYVMSIGTGDFTMGGGGGKLPLGLNPVGIGLDKEEKTNYCYKSSIINPFYNISRLTCLALLIDNGFTDKDYPIKTWGK